MSIVRALASLATAGVLALAPAAAFAASTDDYTVVSPPVVSPPKARPPAVLPNTGVDSSTIALGAAGALLLVSGSGVVIASRRRKTAHA